MRPLEGRPQGRDELRLLVALALDRPDGVDHALERQAAGGGDDGVTGRDRPLGGDQGPPLLVERPPGRPGDDPGHTAPVGQMAVGRVDDGVDLGREEVADLHDERPTRRQLREGDEVAHVREA
ncbi:MAG: hypothetical protein M9894_31575 [Planctomycetes bacterium]|nr:hypothetical protein [Planctomycetota bacterium]